MGQVTVWVVGLLAWRWVMVSGLMGRGLCVGAAVEISEVMPSGNLKLGGRSDVELRIEARSRARFTLEHGGDDGERLAKASRNKLIKESNKDYKGSGSGGDGTGTEFLRGGVTDCGTIPEVVWRYGEGVTASFAKASGSELMRLTITIIEVAMKVMEVILSFAIGNSLSF
nr:hypothetical protein CFP56_45546 [Quercus suber]